MAKVVSIEPIKMRFHSLQRSDLEDNKVKSLQRYGVACISFTCDNADVLMEFAKCLHRRRLLFRFENDNKSIYLSGSDYSSFYYNLFALISEWNQRYYNCCIVPYLEKKDIKENCSFSKDRNLEAIIEAFIFIKVKLLKQAGIDYKMRTQSRLNLEYKITDFILIKSNNYEKEIVRRYRRR